MKIDLGPKTNKGTAFLRLIHQFRDNPLVEDTQIRWFFGTELIQQAQLLSHQIDEPAESGEDRFLQIAHWWVILRERFVDDVVKAAIEGGCEQVLNLGAGFDTRFFRLRTESGGPVETYEVDLPDTVSEKSLKIEEECGGMPDGLHLIPLDLRKRPLSDLLAHGFSRARRTICVWQGVCYYLAEEQVWQTLEFVRDQISTGTTVVFDACTPLMLEPNDSVPGIRSQIQKLNQIGEPYRFGRPPEKLSQDLLDRGFVSVDTELLPDTEHRYLGRRSLPANMWYMVVASSGQV